MKDISILESIIIGRVEPHIYAFETGTVPNYLKVGDTYRPVSVRLNEWKEYFPDLEKQYEGKAKVDSDVYFRDFAVHNFLESEKKRIRLQQADIPIGVYYSKEFFKEATAHDIMEAIEDITQDYQQNGGKYQFYNAETHLPETFTYSRTESYNPRPNQYETIRNFKAAIDAGRTNLLMYAVMRFGKSFTSMCCALEMGENDENDNPKGANIVVVVSAKADVKKEWKKTVESHTKFVNYVFIDGSALLANDNIIKETLANGKKAAIFLTLQDLQGDEIKEKHKEVFENQIDLLIVDETHFGARAEKYGQVLRELGKEAAKATIGKKDADDFVEASEADEQIKKVLKPKVRLHLSGTPYRILMGSEFTKNDIIAFCQFSDIVKEQEKWDRDHFKNIENEEINPDTGSEFKEWDNPYYGFPQMIRFALNPNESSRRRLKELKESGVSFAFSALLKPKSVKKVDDGSHKKFVFEQEVLDLLEVIDGGKEDDELLGFLDYDKIKDGNMCRHIVMVLPYCASCDAMEALIRNNPDKFKNLSDYEIVNISGLDVPSELGDPQKIKNYIQKCEEGGKKTLTLTVNRMLTGSTVEEWDTMLFLKDTSSPQEYDQAIFRLQNQYIKKYVDDDGNIIKYNMKPQTLLVDFMPGRMFYMQEQKAQIYNVNVDDTGNSKLEERLKEELRISPIIVMNKDKMEQVEATDILNVVSEYSKSRGVAEETLEIPVDLSLMSIDAIRLAIERENELGSKAGLTIKAVEGDETDIDTDDESGEEPSTGGTETHETGDDTGGTDNEEKKNDLTKQFRSYYARILFFAFLTKDTVISLENIISKMETGNNARIAKNIGITKTVLESIWNNINKFILRDLDYSIFRLNKLSKDMTVEPVERANVAVHKFGKLGESEVITPKNICDDMVALVPDGGFTGAIENGHKILDIAGKAGEFALAVYERYASLGYGIQQIKDTIYTIPTSGLTYEFTRMIYEILGLNVANIAEKFNDYDLLKIQDENNKIDYDTICAILSQNKPFCEIAIDDEIIEGDEKVKFDVVVGNPPYQVSDGGAQASARPIYQNFVMASKTLSPSYVTLVMPSRWYAGGKGLDEFRTDMLSDNHIEELHDFLHPEEVFPDTNNRGGVCYFLYNAFYDNSQNLVNVVTHNGNGEVYSTRRSMKTGNLDIFVRSSQAISVMNKIFKEDCDVLSNHISAAKAFGFRTFFINNPLYRDSPIGLTDPILCYGRAGKKGYVERADVRTHNDWIDLWKVYVPESNNIGTELNDDNQNAFVGYPQTICTETFLVIGADLTLNQESATNLCVYLKTKFARFLLSLAKISQHGTAKTYCFVPIQDFSHSWTDAELYEKYNLTPEEIAFIESTIKPMK